MAVDGVLEINQTCAMQTGCFPGDAPGLPVVIDRDEPASYRLTSSLVSSDPNAHIVEIRDDHVTLDLNGFAINGPSVCSGDPPSCTNTGTGKGVTTDVSRTGITVRNGVVRGAGHVGVGLGNEARVERVLVVGNGLGGIEAGLRSHIQQCQVTRNASNGISVGGNSNVRENVVSGNAATGIGSGSGSSIVANASTDNGETGIAGSLGMIVADNTVTGNGTFGVFVDFSGEGVSTITGNNVSLNDGGGIRTGDGATVSGNTVNSNLGWGLQLGASYALEFDGSALGVPESAAVDGVSMSSLGELLLSFDTTVDLGGVVAADEDVVGWDGVSVRLAVDGSALGIPEELDVDGFHDLQDGREAFSFDGSGVLGGVAFDDEDVLVIDPSGPTWTFAYDGSAQHPELAAADVEAVALPEPGQLLMLASGLAVLVGAHRRRTRS